MKWDEEEEPQNPPEEVMIELPKVKKSSIFDKIVPKVKPK